VAEDVAVADQTDHADRLGSVWVAGSTDEGSEGSARAASTWTEFASAAVAVVGVLLLGGRARLEARRSVRYCLPVGGVGVIV